MGPRGARIMFVNVQSIQDSRGQVKIHKKSHKKSCAHEIIHLNNMHGTKHTTEYVFYELKHILDFHFHLFIKKPPHLLS